jgi:sterol desaturase/sphingolipid hydroxylase (fatty acid hydroxylase superfamily)
MGVNGILGLYFLPIFAALIGAELWVARRRGLKLYSRDQTIASLVIALGQRVISPAVAALKLSLAAVVGQVFFANRLFDIPMETWWAWALLFVGTEFTYYWFHRASHEVRWFWTTHAVHHSIEEMNILGSYRLGWTGVLSMGFLFHTPLMLIGFPPAAVVLAISLNLFYQSWLHTNLIGKLGPIEGWLNTPSAHRVHHATNADYLDRNYGGVTLVFDRLFGTYQAERDDEKVVYGLIKPVGSSNPFIIAFHEWVRLIGDLKRARLADWPGHLFGPPGWRPGDLSMTSEAIRARWRAQHPGVDAAPAAEAQPAAP